MEGMILAAGAGTRLGPITRDLPKAMVEVGGKPLLEWVVGNFVKAGIDLVRWRTEDFRRQRILDVVSLA